MKSRKVWDHVKICVLLFRSRDTKIDYTLLYVVDTLVAPSREGNNYRRFRQFTRCIYWSVHILHTLQEIPCWVVLPKFCRRWMDANL